MGWEELLRGFFGGREGGKYMNYLNLLFIKIPTIKVFVKMVRLACDQQIFCGAGKVDDIYRYRNYD